MSDGILNLSKQEPMTKICTKCNIEKDITEYSKTSSRSKDGLHARCKLCIKKYKDEYRKKHKDIIKEYMKTYRENNKDELKKSDKEYRENNKGRKSTYYEDNKDKIQIYRNNHKQHKKEYDKLYREVNKEILNKKKKEYRLNKLYKLTFEEKENMLILQSNKCYICKKDLDILNNPKSVCIDHNHDTGQVRKILCSSCNIILCGQIKHTDINIWELDNSIQYLIKQPSTNYIWTEFWKHSYPEKFEMLLEQCNHMCEICHLDFTSEKNKTKLNIDHNRLTGHIRGILCNRCNTRLGHAKDDITILEESKKYLLEH